MNAPTYWADDPYWTNALDRYAALRASGTTSLTVDLAALDAIIYRADGPAYRLLTAMEGLRDVEAMDGMRGAPRLLLAALILISEADGSGE